MSTIERDYKLYKAIHRHRERVAEYLMRFVTDLQTRALVHDNSKFEEPEFSAYSAVIEEFEKHKFGTDGYNNAKKVIEPAAQHHFKLNRHHPEHHTNGIDDMTLVDLLELVADWKSATLNHPNNEGNLENSIEMLSQKYHISPQLKKILLNTAQEFTLLSQKKDL